jgi:hypothetical protein
LPTHKSSELDKYLRFEKFAIGVDSSNLSLCLASLLLSTTVVSLPCTTSSLLGNYHHPGFTGHFHISACHSEGAYMPFNSTVFRFVYRCLRHDNRRVEQSFRIRNAIPTPRLSLRRSLYASQLSESSRYNVWTPGSHALFQLLIIYFL